MVLHVHVTAFGPFGGCPVNPTALLIESLPSFLATHPPLPSCLLLADLLEMETSAHAAHATLTHLHSLTPSSSPLPVRHLWLHLGVHPRASHLLLESCAYNEMDFRIPDQRQYQPHHVPIVASAPFRLSTRVDTPLLHSLLQPAHAVRLSCDAGRFLCNYTLFLSLQLCREKRGGGGGGGGEEDALFVHVPPFERVGQEEQLSFLYDLLHALGTMEEAGVRWVREEGEGGEEGLVTTMGLGMLSDQIDAASYPRTQQALRDAHSSVKPQALSAVQRSL